MTRLEKARAALAVRKAANAALAPLEVGIRMRPYEYAAVEAARELTGESQSVFLRRAALLLARDTIEDGDRSDEARARQ